METTWKAFNTRTGMTVPELETVLAQAKQIQAPACVTRIFVRAGWRRQILEITAASVPIEFDRVPTRRRTSESSETDQQGMSDQ